MIQAFSRVLDIFLGKFYDTSKNLGVLVHQINKLVVKCVNFLKRKIVFYHL